MELGDTISITVIAISKNAASGGIYFDCRAVNQRDEKIITGMAKVKAPTQKPTDSGSPYASMQMWRKNAFKKLIDHVKDWERVPTAVCHPCGKEALEGAIDAAKSDFDRPDPGGGPQPKSVPWRRA